MKYVYVVIRGESGEGGSIVGIYESKYTAITEALKQPRYFEPWTAVPDMGKGILRWESFCDYVQVETHTVVPKRTHRKTSPDLQNQKAR